MHAAVAAGAAGAAVALATMRESQAWIRAVPSQLSGQLIHCIWSEVTSQLPSRWRSRV